MAETKPAIQRTLMLLSGGIDSTLTTLILRPEGLLFVDYGQPSRKWERLAVKKWFEYCTFATYKHLMTVKVNILNLRGYMPLRNALLAYVGVLEALRKGFGEVVLGLVAPVTFPDTSALWLDALNELLDTERIPVKVRAPFIGATRLDLLKVLRNIDPQAPLHDTFSCYCPKGRPCYGKELCEKCRERHETLTYWAQLKG